METERLLIDPVRETDREDYFRNISHDRKVLETFICTYTATPEDLDLDRILVSADLDTIKERFRVRMRGILPPPVEQMLEKKHGMFDGGTYDFRFDGVSGSAADLCDHLKKRF